MIDTNPSSVCGPFPARPSGRDDSLVFDPAWRTEIVRDLARCIAAEGAFDRLPILADALEEAGCDDRRILSHARECADHGAHCWVLGLIRGVPPPSPTAVESPRPPVLVAPSTVRRPAASPVVTGIRWATLAVTLLLSATVVAAAFLWLESFLCPLAVLWALFVLASMTAVYEME